MGQANVCVTGPHERLLYVDAADYTVFRRDGEPEKTSLGRNLDNLEILTEWLYDEEGTMNEWDDIEESFLDRFTGMFPSFKRPTKLCWTGPDRERRILAENKLFWIAEEDNSWGMAVELLQKEGLYDYSLIGLQAKHCERYFKGMKQCLLERLPKVGTYMGAYNHETLTAERYQREYQAVAKGRKGDYCDGATI